MTKSFILTQVFANPSLWMISAFKLCSCKRNYYKSLFLIYIYLYIHSSRKPSIIHSTYKQLLKLSLASQTLANISKASSSRGLEKTNHKVPRVFLEKKKSITSFNKSQLEKKNNPVLSFLCPLNTFGSAPF